MKCLTTLKSQAIFINGSNKCELNWNVSSSLAHNGLGTETGIENLKKALAEIEYNKQIFDAFMSDKPIPDPDAFKQMIEESYADKSHIYLEIPDKVYDDAKHHCELVITGEEIDVASKIQTYTTLYQTMLQSGDPRSEQMLSKVVSMTGENVEAIVGKKQPQQVAPQENPSPLAIPANSEPLKVWNIMHKTKSF